MAKNRRYDKDKARKIALENELQARKLLKDVQDGWREDPNTLAEALAFASNFYTYSINNTIIIYEQNPHALYCQSFDAWKKMGFSVLSGEKGIKIWVPVETTLLEVADKKYVALSQATKEQKELYKQGTIKGLKRTTFKIGNTFDISQTNYPVENYPELFSMGYPSSLHDDIFKGIAEFSEAELKHPVLVRGLSSISLRGMNSEDRMIINGRLESTQKLCTTIHELGHTLIDYIKSGKSVAQKEVEADAFTIMLESNYGLPLTDARQRHFVDNYKIWEKEVKAHHEDNTEVDKVMNGVYDNVFHIYKDNIEKINRYVDKHIPLAAEAVKEKSQQKVIGQASPMKKAMERRAQQVRASAKNTAKGIDL